MTRLRRAAAFALTAALTVQGSAFGWSDAGHKIVASIAFRRLPEARRRELADLLREHPRFAEDFDAKMPADVSAADAATQDEWLFQQAAVWPDIVKQLPNPAKAAYDRPVWHYVNFPYYPTPADETALSATVHPNLGTDPPASGAAPKEMNVLQALAHNRAVLGDASKPDADRAVALCWVLHLTGDVHQPLHAVALYSDGGTLADGDSGGNEIPTKQRGELHAVWDRFPGGRSDYGQARDGAVDLLGDATMRAIGDAAEAETAPAVWAAESFALAKDAVYAPEVLAFLPTLKAAPAGTPPKLDLSDEYLSDGGKIARTRLAAAGYRLGVALK